MKNLLVVLLLITLGACAHKKKCADNSSCDKKESCSKEEGKMAAAYGGYCANGMCKNKKVKGNHSYKVDYKGRCYVFSSEKARDNFVANIDENIKKADENWKKFESAGSTR